MEILISKYYSPNKTNQGSLEKWLVPGMGQGKKMNLEYHVAPEIKELLKKIQELVRRTQELTWRDFQRPKLE